MTMCLFFPNDSIFSPFTKPSENVILQIISLCVFPGAKKRGREMGWLVSSGPQG